MKKKIKYILMPVIFIIIVYLLSRISVVREVIYLIFISFAAAYTLKPIQKKLLLHGISKRMSAIVLILALVALLILSFILIMPSMFSESNDITPAFKQIEALSISIKNKFMWISKNELSLKIFNDISNRVNLSIIAFSKKIIDSLIGIGEDFLSILVMPIITYYFLAEGEQIKNKIMVIFPSKSRAIVKMIIKDIDKVLSKYVISQFILSILIGLLTFLILAFYGVKFPIILSLLNGLFNIIPYFGPIFGAIPAIVMALLSSPIKAVWVTIWLLAIQQIEGNIISPKVTGDSVSIHPLLVILLLVIGGKLGGFWGMVLAIPVGVVIKVVYEDLNYYLY